ncbi:MAG: hypothetical protein QXR58_00465 [Candidatus Micrarchaeaceae archaeon]
MGLYGAVLYASAITLIIYSAIFSSYTASAAQISSLRTLYSNIVYMESFDSAVGISIPSSNSTPLQLSGWLVAVKASAAADGLSANESNGVVVIKSSLRPTLYSTIKLN